MILQLFPFRMFFLLVCSTSSRMLYWAHLWTPCLPSIFLSLTLFSIILSKVFRLHFFFLIEFFLFHSGIVLSYFFFFLKKKSFPNYPNLKLWPLSSWTCTHTHHSTTYPHEILILPLMNQYLRTIWVPLCVCVCLQACMCLHTCLCMCMLLSPPPLVWQLMSREASCALLPVPLRVSIIAPNRLRRYLLNQS